MTHGRTVERPRAAPVNAIEDEGIPVPLMYLTCAAHRTSVLPFTYIPIFNGKVKVRLAHMPSSTRVRQQLLAAYHA